MIVPFKEPPFKIGRKVFAIEDQRYHVLRSFGQLIEKLLGHFESRIKAFPKLVMAVGRQGTTEHRYGFGEGGQLSHELTQQRIEHSGVRLLNFEMMMEE